ncbi:hypothetical protein KEM55_007501 [Ascosphaera atra]|nr:hypothetical protein KEM55_007501 [Ascosphaera atra]
MAATTADLKIASKKRKKTGVDSDTATKRRAGAKDSKDTTSSSTSSSTSSKQKIEELEKQISESRKYYNNIAALISMLNIADGANKVNINVAVSLCRVFCRLLAIGQLNRVKGASEGEQMVVAWLRERYQECQNALLVVLKEGTPSQQEQCTHLQGSETQVWTTGYFPQVVAALLDAPEGDTVRTEFMEKFATKYHDIAIYMVLALTYVLISCLLL